ncbi:MAG: NAD(P)H-hydrate dehydratase [Planctomycetaceae bacterium]
MQTVQLSDVPFPQRPDDGHKGTFGKVLLIGGSQGMSGSICLAATAALRGGAGLVTAAVPMAIQAIVAGYEPSYTTIGLPCAHHGLLTDQPLEAVRELVEGRSAVGIGPGLGQSNAAADLVLSVLKESPCPVLLDADALNLAAEYELLKSHESGHPCVLTPHPGEFSRLTGLSVSDINRCRAEVAAEFANRHDLIVVLKGAGTVVTDGQRVYVNSSGNSGMATGGSGDVLTGLLTALLGQTVSPFDAAVLGVYLHGLAGDLAAEDQSEPGMIASDLLRCLGKAWLRFQQNPSG